TVHTYVGVASMTFLMAALATGRIPVSARPRWLGPVLFLLYAGIYASGVLLLLPIDPSIRASLVTAHLLTTVWAVPPTTIYVWHSRAALAQFIGGQLRRTPARLWLALGFLLVPVVILSAFPRTLSPLAQTGTGAVWTPLGPRGVFLDRMAASPDGQELVAGGEGLYVRRP